MTGTLESDWPYTDEVACISFLNSLASESIFIHHRSKTLLVTDMAFNMASGDFKNPIERPLIGKLNGILDQFGPSILTKFVAARSKKDVAIALAKIGSHDFERVIVSHGKIVEKNGKKRFLEAYSKRYCLDLPSVRPHG